MMGTRSRPRAIAVGLALACACAASGAELQLNRFGTPIAHVTAPTGGGNHDIEVIRDGVKPATTIGVNIGSSALQYDTYHGGVQEVEDWIGYEFSCEIPFTKVVFQEGKHFFDGGYFEPADSLIVQVRDPGSGEWMDAEGAWDPPYTGRLTGGATVNFETFTWVLDPPLAGDGIRIWGRPGGSARFISCAELEVFTESEQPAPSASLAVDKEIGRVPLTVTFDASGSAGVDPAYDWDFGDGTTGSGKTVTHTYADYGSYAATLTVTGTVGACRFSDRSTIRIQAGYNMARYGTPIARVTAPTGGGNHDIEVIRDGVKPDLTFGENAGSSALQYDTYDGNNAAADDWIGYAFDCELPFARVVFQEGKHFFDGGYFEPADSLVVQVLNAEDEWVDAPGQWDPPYEGRYTAGQIINFETFVWDIDPPFPGKAIRIYGEPGGSADFISCAELEVYAALAADLPYATATATPRTGSAPLRVAFDATGSQGANLRYSWEFGDGTTGTGGTVEHVYASSGSYRATVTIASDIGGCTFTSRAAVDIFVGTNLARYGTPIARVTAPTGGGNHDIEVIRDGVKPDLTFGENAGSSALQYDTYDGNNVADEDWIGYEFGCVFPFSNLIFQEGKHFFDGGYFDPPILLLVQIRDPATGRWEDIPRDWEPEYTGRYTNGQIVNFETFTWRIDPPIRGDAIRIHGVPGGTAYFISCAELEVWGDVPSDFPTAKAEADVDRGLTLPLRVRFDASNSTGTNLSYEWSFGDGATARGKTVTHDFTKSGDYRVTLRVTTPEGACASDTLLVRAGPFTSEGFIRPWLFLGPYTRDVTGAAPGVDEIRKDYLTDDASVDEFTILPADGLQVDTDYEAAASAGLFPSPDPGINPGGIPRWFAWTSWTGHSNMNDEIFGGGDPNEVMGYAAVYVRNETDSPIQAYIGCGSDDSIQILLDGEEVHVNNVARGYGGPPTVQDVAGPVTLQPGCNRLLVKVFEGAGGWNFALRFQATADLDAAPLQDPAIDVSLDPAGCGGPPPGPRFIRGDTDGSGIYTIGDGIQILERLFTGRAALGSQCDRSADVDDNGALTIGDAIWLFNYLFADGAPPKPPAPQCGVDETPDPLGCKQTSPACR